MMTIGEIARSAACKVQTIRYYEQIGLLAPAERSEGNQRLFARKDVERLLFSGMRANSASRSTRFANCSRSPTSLTIPARPPTASPRPSLNRSKAGSNG